MKTKQTLKETTDRRTYKIVLTIEPGIFDCGFYSFCSICMRSNRKKRLCDRWVYKKSWKDHRNQQWK